MVFHVQNTPEEPELADEPVVAALRDVSLLSLHQAARLTPPSFWISLYLNILLYSFPS